MNNTTKMNNTAKTVANTGDIVIEPVNLDSFLQAVNLDMSIYEKRLNTFKDVWRYRDNKDANCTAERMARAGFFCSDRTPDTDSARCYVCQHELLWDPEDDPWEEHCRHRPDCELVKVGKQDEKEFTVLEQLRIMAYIYSTRHYKYADESMADLATLYEKLMDDTEKMTNNK